MARETLDLISTPVKIVVAIYATAVIATVSFLAGSLTGTTTTATTAPGTVTETTTATTTVTTPVAPCDGPECPPWPSLDY